MLDRIEGDRRGVAPLLLAHDPDAQSLAVDEELLDRPGTEGVSRGNDRRESLRAEPTGELRDSGRLPGAVHSDEQDRVRFRGVRADRGRNVDLRSFDHGSGGALEARPYRFLHVYAHPKLASGEFLAEVAAQALHHAERHVRLQQYDLEVVQYLVDPFVGQPAAQEAVGEQLRVARPGRRGRARMSGPGRGLLF